MCLLFQSGNLILFAADNCVYSAHFVVANWFLAAYFGGRTHIFSLPVFFCPSKPKFIATFPLIFSLLGRPRGRDKAPGLQFYVSLSGTNRVSNTRSGGNRCKQKREKIFITFSLHCMASTRRNRNPQINEFLAFGESRPQQQRGK